MKPRRKELDGRRSESRSVKPADTETSKDAFCVLPSIEDFPSNEGYFSFEQVKRLAETHAVPSDSFGAFFNDLNSALSFLTLLKKAIALRAESPKRNNRIKKIHGLSSQLLKNLQDWEVLQNGLLISGRDPLAIAFSDIKKLELSLGALITATEVANESAPGRRRRKTTDADINFVMELLNIYLKYSTQKGTSYKNEGLYVGAALEFVCDVYKHVKGRRANRGTIGKYIEIARPKLKAAAQSKKCAS